MIKIKPFSTSVSPHPKDIHDFQIRHYKFLIQVKNPWEIEDIPTTLASRLFRSIKSAKKLKKFSLASSTSTQAYIKPKYSRVVLKTHSQYIRELDISTLQDQFSNFKGNFCQLKGLKSIRMANTKINIKSLRLFKKLAHLFLDLRCFKFNKNQLSRAIGKLTSLKTLAVLSAPSIMKHTMETLNEISPKCFGPLKIYIATKDYEQFDQLPDLTDFVCQSVTKLRLQYIATVSVLEDLFVEQKSLFPNLRSLQLEFSIPDLHLVPYLTCIKDMKMLEKLSLYFAECWSEKFSELVIRDLKLPASLKTLKMNMSLSLRRLVTKHTKYITKSSKRAIEYAWRHFNIFEDEPAFTPFLEMLKEVPGLKKIAFKFQMLEGFSPHYTNFFVSILKRLPQICYFETHVIDLMTSDSEGQTPECFDLALFLEACSHAKRLEQIEVIMPNLIFEDIKLSRELTSLKGFNIGISEPERKGYIRFQYISRSLESLVRTLADYAVNLNSLGFDFEEVMDERIFSKRFMQIERLINLEFLYMKVVIKNCRREHIFNVGRSIRSLKKLNTLALTFFDSDKSIFDIKPYLGYHKSLRSVMLTQDKFIWTGSDSSDVANALDRGVSSQSDDLEGNSEIGSSDEAEE